MRPPGARAVLPRVDISPERRRPPGRHPESGVPSTRWPTRRKRGNPKWRGL